MFSGIPLEEGVGTIIEIQEKTRLEKRRKTRVRGIYA